MDRIINKAIKYLNSRPPQKYKICAIILDKKGHILSKGFNSFSKTSPRQAYYAEKYGNKHKIFIHAELDAICKLKYTDEPYSIYIVRVNNQGKTSLAKPCKICAMAIKDAGIKEVYHT